MRSPLFSPPAVIAVALVTWSLPAWAAEPLREAHTVKIVIDDMGIASRTCAAVVLNADTGYVLPDPTCTPGASDPAVTPATLGTTVCTDGYTALVRPPSSTTSKWKKITLKSYGMADDPTVEYDHLVPLSLGGASTTSNLWPQPNKKGAAGTTNPKDALESALRAAVCGHVVELREAQESIARSWTTALSTLGLSAKVVAGRSYLCRGELCAPKKVEGETWPQRLPVVHKADEFETMAGVCVARRTPCA